MATDQTYLKDAEEAWIAKYRAALREVPVENSRSTRVRDALNRAHGITISNIARMLARSLAPSEWKKSVQPSERTPVTQAQTSIRTGNLAESNAKVA
jgi:hypothetical protein